MTFYLDFFLSGFVLCNYDIVFRNEEQNDFCQHKTLFTCIIVLQGIDIVVNFLTIKKSEKMQLQEPNEIALAYLKGSFIPDCIAIFPYSVTYPHLIFLRFLRLLKVIEYQNYIKAFLSEFLQNSMEKEKLIQLMRLFDLIILLCFISHSFAVMWMMLGMNGLYDDPEDPSGWVHHWLDEHHQDFWSIYLASLYYIVTTFSSVGYGEIKTSNSQEMQFNLLMMMVGIGFYGYMVGTLQKLFANLQTKDLLQEQ